MPPVEDCDHEWHPEGLVVYLRQIEGAAAPHVDIGICEYPATAHMTLAEARELAEALLEVVNECGTAQ